MTSPADEGIAAARRDASEFQAQSRLLEVGSKAETLSRLISHEINARVNEAQRLVVRHGAESINWNDVGTMNYVHEELVLIADALGINREGA